jgi:hypothetical protein
MPVLDSACLNHMAYATPGVVEMQAPDNMCGAENRLGKARKVPC